MTKFYPNLCLNPYTPSVLFVEHQQTVQNQIKCRKMHLSPEVQVLDRLMQTPSMW